MMRFRVEHNWASNTFRMWLFDHRNGKLFIAKPMQIDFVEAHEHALLPEATLEIGAEQAFTLLPEVKKQLAGVSMWADKEESDQAKRVETAMQAHIDSLKLVVDRVIAPRAEHARDEK